MSHRRFSLCFVVNVLIIVLVSLLFSSMVLAEKLPEKIVIGCLEPLTGAHAVFGTEAKIGMEFAVQHINESGGIQSLGGIPLELVAEDVGEDAMSARLAAESLISKHHPAAVLGLYISRLTTAASEITEREKVILVADALVDGVTEMGRQYLFREYLKSLGTDSYHEALDMIVHIHEHDPKSEVGRFLRRAGLNGFSAVADRIEEACRERRVRQGPFKGNKVLESIYCTIHDGYWLIDKDLDQKEMTKCLTWLSCSELKVPKELVEDLLIQIDAEISSERMK